jgi:hypothetical protein
MCASESHVKRRNTEETDDARPHSQEERGMAVRIMFRLRKGVGGIAGHRGSGLPISSTTAFLALTRRRRISASLTGPDFPGGTIVCRASRAL